VVNSNIDRNVLTTRIHNIVKNAEFFKDNHQSKINNKLFFIK